MTASQKDDEIVRLVDSLSREKGDWVVVDHWDADRCAIGIAAKNDARLLVFISCFEQKPGCFYVECESPCGPELADFSTGPIQENATYDDILSLLRSHLRE